MFVGPPGSSIAEKKSRKPTTQHGKKKKIKKYLYLCNSTMKRRGEKKKPLTGGATTPHLPVPDAPLARHCASRRPA